MRAVFLFAALALLPGLGSAAAIKCWTNSDGVRECGNAIPPEYAQQRSRTLNDQGITVEVHERAKTREERAEEQRRRAEAERRRQEEDKRRQSRQAYDRMLLATFTTEEELLASRDRRLAAIEATISVTEAGVEQLEQALERHRRRAADLERSGQPLPQALAGDIGNLEAQVADKQAYIRSKEREMAELNTRSEADLARFRELKAARRR